MNEQCGGWTGINACAMAPPSQLIEIPCQLGIGFGSVLRLGL